MTPSLLHCLTREHAAVEEFLDVLDQEAEALGQGQFAGLPALTARKSQLADQIAQLGRERESLQVSLGYTADRQGTEAAAAAGGSAPQNALNNLRACAAQAHERNHRNGVMIHTHLDFTRQTIGFLQSRGKPLYGPDGAHRAGSGSGNSLAQG